jgi:hypothetical protein
MEANILVIGMCISAGVFFYMACSLAIEIWDADEVF